MKTAIHYIVRVKIIVLNEDTNEIEFREYDKKFENENPILARTTAFDHYQSYIDVLLERSKKTYLSDWQARKDLESFIDLGTKTKFKFGEKEIEFNDNYANGIGVYMVIDEPNPNLDDKIGDEFFIHGIKSIGLFSHETIDTSNMMFTLTTEFDYYKYYNYDTENKEIEVIYCDRDEWDEPDNEEPSTNRILKTPFDWEGYDKPCWWGEPEDEENVAIQSAPALIEKMIQQGENNTAEFKSALLYNFKTGLPGIGVKEVNAKTICAFLNSNGGVLFIGLKDDGTTQGLDYDFQLADGKDPEDYFLLEYDQMLEHFLGFSIKDNVTGTFFERDGKKIFVVIVKPIKHRPVFLKHVQNGKEFYVRGEASSRKLTDIEEIVNYCLDRGRK